MTDAYHFIFFKEEVYLLIMFRFNLNEILK